MFDFLLWIWLGFFGFFGFFIAKKIEGVENDIYDMEDRIKELEDSQPIKNCGCGGDCRSNQA